MAKTLKNTSYQDFLLYYNQFKELYKLHVKLNFGRAPDMPSGFSEKLCRKIFDLEKSDSKDYDAIDLSKNKIEIKATSSISGQTTIKTKMHFDNLYWMDFDLENYDLFVSILPKKLFNSYESSLKDRESISLKLIRDNNKNVEKYKIDLQMLISNPNGAIIKTNIVRKI